MRIALSLTALLVGCGGAAPTKAAPVSHHVGASAGPAAGLEPVIDVPAADPRCDLRWAEVTENEPKTIALVDGLAPDDAEDSEDSCPPGFDPSGATCPPDADCIHARMRGGREAMLAVVGPQGSGRYLSMGLVVGKHHACMMGSTVGWRYLHALGSMLAPLPWLADVDGQDDAEVVVWTRLPWGDAEVDNALLPVVYVLDGDRLVRRDDLSHKLRARVAGAYAVLATRPADPEAHACFATLATVLK